MLAAGDPPSGVPAAAPIADSGPELSDARAWGGSRAQYSLPSASITVGEAGALWLAQAESDGLEASTVTQYCQHLTYHIAPFLGDIKLAELTRRFGFS
jgi:Phage integrase, N-terminal SAM-like domain